MSPNAYAQDGQSLAQELEAEEKWLTVLYDLETSLDELMFHHSMAILASYGQYNTQERSDGSSDGTDLTRFSLRINYHEASLGAFKRQYRKNLNIPDDDKLRAENIAARYSEFLVASRLVANFLTEEDPQSANLAFRDSSVPVSKAIGAEIYTLRRHAQDRFSAYLSSADDQ